MSFSQTLLPEFDEEMQKTRKMLERIPDDKFDYQPHPRSMTLGRLASHVAEIPSWAIVTLEQELFELPADFKPEIATSRNELLQKFDQGVIGARARIAAASDQDWQKIWTMKFAGNTIMSIPRAAVMRGAILNHLIHHRAQLGVYLRLNDIAVPGLYGPSADEGAF